MANDCCDNFGGTIYITAAGQRLKVTEGDVTLTPVTREVEAMANQDGSAAYHVKPRLPRAEMNFRDSCGFTWEDWMSRCKLDVTIVEQSNGRQHLFSGTRFVGNPSINLSTGEVSGVAIEGGVYQKVVR